MKSWAKSCFSKRNGFYRPNFLLVLKYLEKGLKIVLVKCLRERVTKGSEREPQNKQEHCKI